MRFDCISGKSVVFFFECSPSLGMGHLFRSLPLVKAFLAHDAEVTVLTSEISIPYLTPYIESLDINCVQSCDSLSSCDVLLVDNYSPGSLLENAIFCYSLKVLIHDYLIALPSGFDILINASTLAPVSSPINCYFGPSYTQLADSYLQIRGRWNPSDVDAKILISFGSTDPFAYTNLLLKSLINIPLSKKYVFIVPLLSSAPHLSSLQTQISQECSNVQLLIDKTDLSSIYLSASACIGASGSSSWERACIGLPSAQLPIIDNQIQVHQTLEKLNMIYSLQDMPSDCHPFDIANLNDFFERLEDANWLSSLSQRASSIVDGAGCKRIVSLVSHYLSNQ